METKKQFLIGELLGKELLICSLCSEYYKDPRLLPCDDTFCRKCIQNLYDEKQAKTSIRISSMPCPKCNGVFAIPQIGVSGLPLDLNIRKKKEQFMNKLMDNVNGSDAGGIGSSGDQSQRLGRSATTPDPWSSPTLGRFDRIREEVSKDSDSTYSSSYPYRQFSGSYETTSPTDSYDSLRQSRPGFSPGSRRNQMVDGLIRSRRERSPHVSTRTAASATPFFSTTPPGDDPDDANQPYRVFSGSRPARLMQRRRLHEGSRYKSDPGLRDPAVRDFLAANRSTFMNESPDTHHNMSGSLSDLKDVKEENKETIHTDIRSSHTTKTEPSPGASNVPLSDINHERRARTRRHVRFSQDEETLEDTQSKGKEGVKSASSPDRPKLSEHVDITKNASSFPKPEVTTTSSSSRFKSSTSAHAERPKSFVSLSDRKITSNGPKSPTVTQKSPMSPNAATTTCNTAAPPISVTTATTKITTTTATSSSSPQSSPESKSRIRRRPSIPSSLKDKVSPDARSPTAEKKSSPDWRTRQQGFASRDKTDVSKSEATRGMKSPDGEKKAGAASPDWRTRTRFASLGKSSSRRDQPVTGLAAETDAQKSDVGLKESSTSGTEAVKSPPASSERSRLRASPGLVKKENTSPTRKRRDVKSDSDSTTTNVKYPSRLTDKSEKSVRGVSTLDITSEKSGNDRDQDMTTPSKRADNNTHSGNKAGVLTNNITNHSPESKNADNTKAKLLSPGLSTKTGDNFVHSPSRTEQQHRTSSALKQDNSSHIGSSTKVTADASGILASGSIDKTNNQNRGEGGAVTGEKKAAGCGGGGVMKDEKFNSINTNNRTSDTDCGYIRYVRPGITRPDGDTLNKQKSGPDSHGTVGQQSSQGKVTSQAQTVRGTAHSVVNTPGDSITKETQPKNTHSAESCGNDVLRQKTRAVNDPEVQNKFMVEVEEVVLESDVIVIENTNSAAHSDTDRTLSDKKDSSAEQKSDDQKSDHDKRDIFSDVLQEFEAELGISPERKFAPIDLSRSRGPSSGSTSQDDSRPEHSSDEHVPDGKCSTGSQTNGNATINEFVNSKDHGEQIKRKHFVRVNSGKTRTSSESSVSGSNVRKASMSAEEMPRAAEEEDSMENAIYAVDPVWEMEKHDYDMPTSVVVLSNDTTVISEFNQGLLQYYDSEGKFVHSVDGIKPFCIATNNADHVIVADRKTKTIRIFDEIGADITQWDTDQFKWISGVACLSNGNFVIYDRDKYKIGIYTQMGEKISDFGSYGERETQLCMADFLTVDSKDRILMCDSGNHSIKIFDTNGMLLKKFGIRGHGSGEMEWPKGICCDNQDNIIVADNRNCRVSLYSPDGDFIQQLVRDYPNPYGVCLSTTQLLGVTHYSLKGYSQLSVYKLTNVPTT